MPVDDANCDRQSRANRGIRLLKNCQLRCKLAFDTGRAGVVRHSQACDPTTGALEGVVSGPAYQFNGPDALAVDAGQLLVANGFGGTVTELPA